MPLSQSSKTEIVFSRSLDQTFQGQESILQTVIVNQSLKALQERPIEQLAQSLVYSSAALLHNRTTIAPRPTERDAPREIQSSGGGHPVFEYAFYADIYGDANALLFKPVAGPTNYPPAVIIRGDRPSNACVRLSYRNSVGDIKAAAEEAERDLSVIAQGLECSRIAMEAQRHKLLTQATDAIETRIAILSKQAADSQDLDIPLRRSA